ncbi:hypothetical protein [Paenibacillus sp. P3E]|uniref:hypothetical protein n=1 Tax=Paenibacillus sp. P3E TaxID=1349435 RepID=UPI00116129E6|nr:hypothetical protein [Paenibacillus sp. P3E]
MLIYPKSISGCASITFRSGKTSAGLAFTQIYRSAGLPLAYGAAAILAHTLITGSAPDMRQFGLTSDLPPQFGGWMTALVWMLTFDYRQHSKGRDCPARKAAVLPRSPNRSLCAPAQSIKRQSRCCLHHFRQSCR